MRKLLSLLVLFGAVHVHAQKKPLDHSVYDGWQSVGERHISPDGRWAAYAVNPQEGDGTLYVQDVASKKVVAAIPRGYNALLTADSRYLVCRIKPLHADTRAARIKKKKAEEMPKDSLAVLALGTDSLVKKARVASYKLPKEAGTWLAYHKEKELSKASVNAATQRSVDSLQKKVDSLLQLVVQLKNTKAGNADDADAEEPGEGSSGNAEGSDLVLRNLATGKEQVFRNVGEYHFDKKGSRLLMKLMKPAKDSAAANAVVWYHLVQGKTDTLLKGGNDFRNLAISDDGTQAAFVAERDSSAKALQKFYGLYHYAAGMDSARKVVNLTTIGLPAQWTVSEHGNLVFSKSGKRLFFGTAPIKAPRDTSLAEIDQAKLDIWHYKDDYLQSQQLYTLQQDLKRNYLAMFDVVQQKVLQLADKAFPIVLQTADGDGAYFYAATDTGRRVQSQWSGRTPKDLYAIEMATGKRTLLASKLDGQTYVSTTGKYMLWYDAAARQYFCWDGATTRKVSAGIPHPLFDEDHDTPSEPGPYGVMGWHRNDSFAYVYDRYDVWRVDPSGRLPAVNLLGSAGRKQGVTYRFVRTDTTERSIAFDQPILFRAFDNKSKQSGLRYWVNGQFANSDFLSATSVGSVVKAKDADVLLYTKESFTASPDLYVSRALRSEDKLSATNPQQGQYNWGTAELVRWKTFDGKTSEGILYKPEDFDSSRKYPMIAYFYEKLSDGLYTYNAPAPTPSRLNISFYVSRGYLVFAPDISYTRGQPAKDAYNYIVSGMQHLARNKWVDKQNLAIQGQSWGGYQVLALLVQTSMFKAAWAGAPVANMTSAYGGIRWESGVNRQFQYEKGQSRIGYTLWERPELYVQNSPLFQLPKVKTPLVIMSNDADGAVPWYQGIELFTAMRRLGKPVWLLNYNGEAHNLVERRNRKDIQVRQQQYFDWLLKGAAPARWITDGVPAVEKGKDWGLQVEKRPS